MLNDLVRAIKNGRLCQSVHVIVRYRPATPEIPADSIELNDVVTFTKPCENFFQVKNAVQAPTKDWEFSPDDAELLTHSIKHSDIIISTYSTIAIDAAACNKPIIGIRYDADRSTPRRYQVEAIHDAHDHYGELEQTGGIRLVHDMDECIQAINFYLEHPEADAAGRKQMCRDQIEFFDGKNGIRAAEFIKKAVRNTAQFTHSMSSRP